MLLNARFPLRYIFKHIRADVVRVLLISSFFHLLKLWLGEYLPLIPLQLPTILGSSIARRHQDAPARASIVQPSR